MISKYYSIYDTIIEISSNNSKLFDNHDLFKHFTKCDKCSNVEFSFIYLDIENESVEFNEKDKMIFTAPYDELNNNESLKTLIMTCVQWILQMKGLFMIHASCVAKDNEAMLLFGSSGAGKTSLAMDLCINKGYKFISNGSTILKLENGIVYAYGPVKKGIKLRYSSYSRMNLENAEKLFLSKKNRLEDGFDVKLDVSVEQLGIEQENKKTPVNKIYTVKILNTESKLVNIDPYRMQLTLHQDLSRFLRCSSTYLIYGKKFEKSQWIKGLDNEKIHKMRIELIRALVSDDVRGKSLYGDLYSISKLLSNEDASKNVLS